MDTRLIKKNVRTKKSIEKLFSIKPHIFETIKIGDERDFFVRDILQEDNNNVYHLMQYYKNYFIFKNKLKIDSIKLPSTVHL